MTCSETRRVIGAFVDGEIDPVTAVAVDRHLKECAACSREEAAIRSLGEVLRRPELSFRAPEKLADFARSASVRGSGSSKFSRRQNSVWLGLAASFIAGVLVTWGIGFRAGRQEPRQGLAEELLSAHVRSLLPNHLIDVESTDQHTVKPWFAGKLDYSPPVANLADQGFPLVGGRLDALEGHPIAALVYQRRQHLINVFICPAGRVGGTTSESLTLNGYHLVGGKAAGMDFWLVSDLDLAELAQFNEAFKLIATAGTRPKPQPVVAPK